MNKYIIKQNKYIRKSLYLTGGLLGGSLNNDYLTKYNNYNYSINNISNINKYNKLVDGLVSSIITTYSNYSSDIKKEEKITNEFKYILVNYDELIEWLTINPELKKSIETCIQDFRGVSFKVEQLKEEEKSSIKLGKNTLYFFIYNNQEMISSSRLFYFSNSIGYINFVYTNPKYRGQKMCQKNIKLLIYLTSDLYNIKIYELHVEIDNVSAIKCYENNGFVFIKDTIEEWNIKGKLKQVQKMNLVKKI
jgi:RimJ/RimL family protein N-acetyltransferase